MKPLAILVSSLFVIAPAFAPPEAVHARLERQTGTRS